MTEVSDELELGCVSKLGLSFCVASLVLVMLGWSWSWLYLLVGLFRYRRISNYASIGA